VSVISHEELLDLVMSKVINCSLNKVNGASIDLTLGKFIRVESKPERYCYIDLIKKQNIATEEVDITMAPYAMYPGEFVLAQSVEIFNLPRDICAEYMLKSSMARNGLNHFKAGWCDPGWNNSTLTLELQNCTQHHVLKITQGMPIGQMVFHRVNEVPERASYAKTGQYNDQEKVTESKGIR